MHAGANVASYLMMPRNVQSLGASGAVFGLFVVAVVSKLSWNPRKLLESAILGQFVIQQVINVRLHSYPLLKPARKPFYLASGK
jgi:membrane associated rhomboid family serine protease